MSPSRREGSSADEYPKCGELSYVGGYCFGCGNYRPSKTTDTTNVEDLDVTQFMERGFGTQISALEYTEEDLYEDQQKQILRSKHPTPRKDAGKWRSIEVIGERTSEQATMLVQAVVEPYGKTKEGEIVRAVLLPWQAIAERLKKDWSHAFEIPPRVWEELVAAAFDRDGFDEVILTPRSGDFGRDVVAVKKGVGCIRIIGSVKAYAHGRLVTHDDVRSLAGVLYGDHNASKGMVTTTSDFAPKIVSDPYLSPLMPYRLELMNGKALQNWISRLAT